MSLANVLIKTVRRVAAERAADWRLIAALREQVSVLLELLASRDATIARKDRVIRALRAEIRALQPAHLQVPRDRAAA